MPQTYEELRKNTLEHIKATCKNNIERIDRLCETAVNTDVDLGMAYAYRRILDIINESEG